MTLYAFDGTGKAWGGHGSTHVFDTAMSYEHSTKWSEILAPGERRKKVYIEGVGTNFGLVGRLLGGLTGFGAKSRARRAYQQLCERYADEHATAEDLMIDVIGFSRGAATALHFTNLVRDLGIRQPRPDKWWKLNEFNTYRPYRARLGWILFRDWPLLGTPKRNSEQPEISGSTAEQLCERLAEVAPATRPINPANSPYVIPRIRFVGLWDAVGSFGFPVDARAFNFQAMNFGFDLLLPNNVDYCAHAMALNERRKTYRNLRVVEKPSTTSKDQEGKLRLRQFNHFTVVVGCLGLVAWPAGLLDDLTQRTAFLAFFSVLFGCTRMLRSFLVPPSQRWRGMQLTELLSYSSSMFMISQVVVEGLGPGTINEWFVFPAFAVFLLAESFSERELEGRNGDQISTDSSLPKKAEAMAEKLNWMQRLLKWMLGLVEQAVRFTTASGDRRPRCDWKVDPPTINEVWFRGNHTDVGGGGAAELARVTHEWVCAEARRAEPELILTDNPYPYCGETVEMDVSTNLTVLPNRIVRRILHGDLLHATVPAPGTTETAPTNNRKRIRQWRLIATKKSPSNPRPITLLDERCGPYRLLKGDYDEAKDPGEAVEPSEALTTLDLTAAI